MRVILLATVVLLAACGTEDESTDGGGFDRPASVVTDANLLPGSLIGLDADELKAKMEAGGEGNYRANSSDDDDEEEDDCFNKVFEELKIEASGDKFRISGELDLSECFLASYEESFDGGDFSGLAITATSSYAFYVKCSGQDFSSLDGKGFTSLDDDDFEVCNESESVESLNETKTLITVDGTITETTIGGQTGDYTFDVKSESYATTRTTGGGACSGTTTDGVVSWKNGCVTTNRSIDIKNSSGLEGAVTEEDNIGKSKYEQLVYKDLKENADSTSPWYADGGFEVTYHDWSGTVTYASATSEPIFEMTKGSETVTGTIKDEPEDADANTMHFAPSKFDFKSIINATIR